MTVQTYQASFLEVRHHQECWYQPDELGWRCVAICPVKLTQPRLL